MSKTARFVTSAVLIIIFLSVFSILTPVLVHADSYDGPFCYESKNETSVNNPDPSGIRGTCKEIQMKDVVSLDPAMQKDYFLGTHNAIGIECDRECYSYTKYSEELFISGSSTITVDAPKSDYVPTEVAVFNKSFFLPLLLNQFKQNNLNYSENNFPGININVYELSELTALQNNDAFTDNGSGIISKNIKMDTLQKTPVYCDASDNCASGYYFNTLSYQEYGKYIWGPKGDLVESQYANLNQNNGALTDKDLGISYKEAGKDGGPGMPTVSVTDPLNSVTNYWVYSEVNGTPTLSWQKTEYAMDDGTVKTVVPTVTNTKTTATHNAASTTSTSTTQNESSVGKNIFQKIWDFIASWFK
jgi:hypothetical protein